MADDAAILELRTIGHAVQVTAIDPATLVQISFQAPANTPKVSLHRLAAMKLARAAERAAGTGRI